MKKVHLADKYALALLLICELDIDKDTDSETIDEIITEMIEADESPYKLQILTRNPKELH